MRREFAEWQPFNVSSDILLSSLKQWRQAYNLPRSDDHDSEALIINGSSRNGAAAVETERVMTPWEGLLWSLWLPKVRSGIKYVHTPAD